MRALDTEMRHTAPRTGDGQLHIAQENGVTAQGILRTEGKHEPYALRARRSLSLVAALVLAVCGAAACSKQGCASASCPQGSVPIPAGSFEMGTSKKVMPDVWQLKPRKVTLTRPYCMDRTEVTQRAYELCQEGKGCYREPDALPLHASGHRHPRDFTDWDEAVTFCKWKGGRLPTEAEWEFAARGTDGRLYPWGNEPPTKQHWRYPYVRGTEEVVDVGSYPKGRSAFGLDDMSGNVSEWVSDPCGEHDETPDVDPTGPDNPHDRRNCYIVRGAAWSAGWESWAFATFRQYGIGGDSQTGFRCAYDPK